MSSNFQSHLRAGLLSAGLLSIAFLTTSCETTPGQNLQNTAAAAPASATKQAQIYRFFGYRNGSGRPTTISFTDVNPQTGTAKKGGLKSFVLGGVAVPGILDVKSLRLTNHRIVGDSLLMDAEVDSTYIGIPPKCFKSTLTVRATASGLSVKFKPVYCNWVGIGNVISYLKFRDLDFQSDRITGKYNLGVNGTANGTGAGYFVMRSR